MFIYLIINNKIVDLIMYQNKLIKFLNYLNKISNIFIKINKILIIFRIIKNHYKNKSKFFKMLND